MAANDPVTAAVAAGSGVAKEVSGRRARSLLDSTTPLVDVAGLMSGRTLDRTSRYLAAKPTADSRSADFVLEVNVDNSGIDVRGRSRLTPFLYGKNDRVPTGAITAAVLNTVSVAGFQRALERRHSRESGNPSAADRLPEFIALADR